MHDAVMLGQAATGDVWQSVLNWLWGSVVVLKVLIGFSLIIFVHELGHFLAARWMGVRVDRFAIGFFTRVCGWRKGEGFTFGPRPEYTPEKLAEKQYGETDYCLNALPFGGYVRMLGEDDILIDEKSGQLIPSADPRAFTNKPVWRRMIVISAGVVFNMVFAVLVYAAVFMTVGKNVRAPLLGYVEPGGPAARAGLAAGDRVLKVDGEPIAIFDDIIIGALLAKDRVTYTIQRGNETPRDVVVTLPPSKDDVNEVLKLRPPLRNRIPLTAPPDILVDGLKPGDTITQVDSTPINSGVDIEPAWMGHWSDSAELTVERDNQRVVVPMTKNLFIAPIDVSDERSARETRHILGLQPRQAARTVMKGDPASRGGMQDGDAIVRWGTIVNPTWPDILDSIYASDGKPIEVVVERDGQDKTLEITPTQPVSLLGSGKPRVGVEFGLDDRDTIVADVAPDTPAAALGIPRGARIVAINDTPVKSWFEIVDLLRSAAGKTVAVRYSAGADEATGELAAPASIVSEFGLSPLAKITRIDGQDRIETEPGKFVALPAAQAVRALLHKCSGRTVTIEYDPDGSRPAGELTTRTFAVTADNYDPWQMRVTFMPPRLALEMMTEPLIQRNPVKAFGLALSTTGNELYKVYRMVHSMLMMNVSLRHVSGPVGIFGVAYQEASAGVGDLMFFLAFLSVNLAVLNFLPLPVVDGGLMVFLILEKIRGKPVSIKVQVITTLTGLALIVLCFLFVTIQDITRLFGA